MRVTYDTGLEEQLDALLDYVRSDGIAVDALWVVHRADGTGCCDAGLELNAYRVQVSAPADQLPQTFSVLVDQLKRRDLKGTA